MARSRAARSASWRLIGGSIAPLLFISTFTVLGLRRPGYDWRRDAVSSLAVPPGGIPQQINFIATGLLFAVAAGELRRRPTVPRVASWLIHAAGVALVGSGIWVTDSMRGPHAGPANPEPPVSTPTGRLRNLSALPIFVGLPVAALASGVSAARDRDWVWSAVSSATAVLMPACFVCFGAAYGGAPAFAGRGGIFQRLAIVTGFGWVAAVFLRALQRRREQFATHDGPG